jgi:hypothetical protein
VNQGREGATHQIHFEAPPPPQYVC